MQKRFQILTMSRSRSVAEKQSFSYVEDAQKAACQYMQNGYIGAAIYDIINGKWCNYYGKFKKVCSVH